METTSLYHFAADAVLLLHVLFVVFVVLGLMLIYIGCGFGWVWIRSPKFRIAHLCAIGIVTVQAWLGVICPLTSLENLLREQAGETPYAGTFMSYWLHKILYYDAPNWVFIVCYTAFGALVLASWFLVRPDPSNKRSY